ncbi:uncharacterized protein L969DRAFT_15876 [Mixia osmundae IAM 14324]|uniref:Uncharacterized protein n=1 Tax=Mixia osmundae (strain CBS 9802 / IAM 14324 / JCM 22182 / KY 12970) TaxID=764103 RepID=G7E668_MIXOS|nr:uncharacterized protein L969DRAFT_15876 [Mixia osmundae IAM 14324]KEI40518.1 hypothetical protein L969DRAFT_15876 [Mixia osmundae IAM 14324]GAA98328.1 hypothetical protein E5Q_05013 [Mixia osmundae IAM 14324]
MATAMVMQPLCQQSNRLTVQVDRRHEGMSRKAWMREMISPRSAAPPSPVSPSSDSQSLPSEKSASEPIVRPIVLIQPAPVPKRKIEPSRAYHIDMARTPSLTSSPTLAEIPDKPPISPGWWEKGSVSPFGNALTDRRKTIDLLKFDMRALQGSLALPPGGELQETDVWTKMLTLALVCLTCTLVYLRFDP